MQSRREIQRQNSENRSLKFVRNLLLIILLIFLLGWISYAVSNLPRAAARRQATGIARKYAGLRKENAFYIYNREKTYYTVAGKNNKNQQVLVIVPQKGGNVRVVQQSKGITKNQALTKVWRQEKPKKVLKVAPGVFNDHVVWEVTYQNSRGNLCYDLLKFSNGQLVQQINNL